MHVSTLPMLALLSASALTAEIPEPRMEPLKAHMAFLADDLLEGRGTGERGGDLAVRYLETQLRLLGLKPANGNSYLQNVKLTGIQTLPQSRLTLQGANVQIPLKLNTDIAAGIGPSAHKLDLNQLLVFVGHGTDRSGRDDFKGVDLKGKIMVCLVGLVPEIQGNCCTSLHYAARWRAKFEEAKAKGAAGAILIHTTASAGYGWEVASGGFTHERFQVHDSAEDRLFKAWLSESAARKMFKTCGLDLDRLKAASDRHDFKPIPMDLRLKGQIRSHVRPIVQQNVVGLIPGTDLTLKDELLVYSAHWDHLGLDPKTGKGWNGAVDNGSACASLLAVTEQLVKNPARRSQMVIFPCAEEPGLLGAEAYVKDPLWPLAKTIACLNFESLNVWGPTRDIGIAGSETSSLYLSSVKVAEKLGLKIAKNRPDTTGLYFRTDHFPFAKYNIPAFSPGFTLNGGWDFLDEKQGQQAAEYGSKHYHFQSDDYDPNWDLRGLMQQTRFILGLGLELANADARPQWLGEKPTF